MVAEEAGGEGEAEVTAVGEAVPRTALTRRNRSMMGKNTAVWSYG